MLADEVDYVIGVDTHRDEHVLAVVAAPSGAVVALQSVRASERGYAQSVQFVEQHSSGRRVWAVEGAGHYGAGLARDLTCRGETVLEIRRRPRDERRLQGKDDSLDAIRAARTALASKTLSSPRAGQRREAVRLLLLARRSAVEVRRQALVQLRSVIVTCPDQLREDLRGLPAGRLILRCSRLRRSSPCRPDELASRLVLRSLARRVEAATTEAAELEREILAHVQALAPQLLDEPGIGPIVAAQLIVTWSHPGRVRSEAAFARLAGVAPIPASSGQTIRHRLSRGGDRQLNCALHTVILHRRQHDPATKDYIARRVAEGKTTRDAVRLLKRYLARHLYRLLSRLEDAGSGLAHVTDGWFIVNVRDAQWFSSETRGAACWFANEYGEPPIEFPQLGINVTVLEPGQSGVYHAETNQEAFLVLSGECRLLVEGEERSLRPWDFFHCPPWTEHTFVGAGDGPCAILMVGAHSGPAVRYPVSDLAARYGASVDEETSDPQRVYANAERFRRERPPCWNHLPWAVTAQASSRNTGAADAACAQTCSSRRLVQLPTAGSGMNSRSS